MRMGQSPRCDPKIAEDLLADDPLRVGELVHLRPWRSCERRLAARATTNALVRVDPVFGVGPSLQVHLAVVADRHR